MVRAPVRCHQAVDHEGPVSGSWVVGVSLFACHASRRPGPPRVHERARFRRGAVRDAELSGLSLAESIWDHQR